MVIGDERVLINYGIPFGWLCMCSVMYCFVWLWTVPLRLRRIFIYSWTVMCSDCLLTGARLLWKDCHWFWKDTQSLWLDLDWLWKRVYWFWNYFDWQLTVHALCKEFVRLWNGFTWLWKAVDSWSKSSHGFSDNGWSWRGSIWLDSAALLGGWNGSVWLSSHWLWKNVDW